MNGGGFKPSLAARIAAFIKRSRQNTAVRRITNVMAVFVVFITTYMMILPAITLESAGTLNITDVTGTNAAYDGENYTASLEMDFTIDTQNIINNNYVAIYYLPEGVAPPTADVDVELPDNDGNFTYYYRYDSSAGLWYIEVHFDESYINGMDPNSTGVTATGYVKFNATISSDLWSEQDGIKTQFADNVYLEIATEEISYPANSTGSADITVSKSASSYNSAENYIEYSVTVSTTKGSGDEVTLTDVLGTLTNLSVKSVRVQSVTYTCSGTETTASSADSAADVEGTASGSAWYIDTTAGGGDFTMTLSEMDADSTYTIVYRVYLDDITENVTESVANSIKAAAKDGIYYVDTASIQVNYSYISKSYVQNSDGTITWTVTINASGADIAGYTFTDSMLAYVEAYKISIVRGDGTTANEGSDYTVTRNASNGSYADSFTFNGVDEYYNVVQGGTNTNTYVFNYTTSNTLTLGESSTVKNDATLTASDGTTVAGIVSASVSGTGGGISKTSSGAEADSDGDGLITVNWTTVITVPAGGIASGTIIGDYLDNDESVQYGSGEIGYTSLGGQWFTYEQIQQIYCTVSSSYYTNYIQGTADTGSTALTANYGTHYTIQVYCINVSTGEGAWVDLATVISDSATYNATDGNGDAVYKFTAYQMVFNSDVALTDQSASYATITFTYSTTADISSISSAAYFRNQAAVQNGSSKIEATATHEEAAYVTKTDGNGNSGATYTTLSADSGETITLTWIVKAYVPTGSTTTYYEITDTLPSDITLQSVTASNGTTSVELTNSGGTLTGTMESGTISGTVSGQDVTIRIPAGSYASLLTDGGYLSVTYTCTVTYDSSEYEDNTQYTIGSYTNSATVSTNVNANFGSASQTQNYYYKNTVAVESKIAKSGTWNESTGRYSYSVVINPYAEDLLDGSDELTLTDQLSAYMEDNYGQYASIVPSSVEFYELIVLTDNQDGTYSYTDSEGTVHTYSADDSSLYTYKEITYLKKSVDISWTYSATNSGYGWNYYTITSTVPDETAILVEYTYILYGLNMGDLPTKEADSVTINVTNSASLSGTSESTSYSTNHVKYYDHGNEAGMLGLTIYKVDSANYSTLLEDAIFEIYIYDGTVNAFVSTGITITTGAAGTAKLLQSTLTDGNGKNWFAYNTAYYLAETSAPEGYYLDSVTLYYFYWANDDTTTYPETYPSSDFTSTTGEYNGYEVYNLTKMTHSVYVENVAKTYVEVEKVWRDQNGNTITEDLPESVTVSLYYYTTTSETTTVDEKASMISGGDVTLVASGIELNSENDWTAKVTSSDSGDALLTYSEATGLYYHYYFVETAVGGTAVGALGSTYSLSYTTSDGTDNAVAAGTTNAGKVTITNTVDRAYADISADKNWAYDGSSKTVAESAKQEVTLLLLRSSDGGITVELVSEVTLDGTVDDVETAAWKAPWTDLLYSYTQPNGTEVTYTYYICEICDDTSVSIAYNVGTDSSNTITYSATVTDLQGNETTVSCTAYAITLTGDNTNGYTGEVAVTNTIPEPEKKSVTTEKIWQDYDGNETDPPEDAEVTLQLYASSGVEDGPAGGTFTESGAYVTGDTSGYVVTLKYDSQSGSYTLVVPITGETEITLSETSNTYTFTDTAGDTIALTLDGGSITWSGMDGAYDYYVVETSASSGGTALSTGADGYTTYYSVDGGATTGTDAADYAGLADETVSNAASTENEYTVINRANSGTTELTVNKVFTGGTEAATAVYIQLWQVAEVTITSASGEVTTSTSTVQVTDTSYGTNTTQSGVFYYVLNSGNSWTMDFTGLADGSRVTDGNGTVTETVYSYYVVETGASTSNTLDSYTNLDSYEATYTAGDGSAVAGTITIDADNDGTDETAYLVESSGVTITNADAYAILAIEKEWVYQDGSEADASGTDSATFELWQEASYKVYTGTYYTVNVYYDTTLKATKLVPANTAVTITIPSSGLYGYNVYRGDDPSVTWSSDTIRSWGNTVPIELTADEVTNNINVYYWGSDGTCTISYEDEDNDSGISVLTVLKKIGEVTLNSANAWTYNWQLETEGTITVEGTTYDCTYTYYLTETSAAFSDNKLTDMTVQVTDSSGSTLSAVTVTDSSGTTVSNAYAVTLGTTLTTVTASNQVPKEEEETTSVSVTKTWATSIQEASVTFTLIQLLVNPDSTSDDDKWITDSSDNVVVNASEEDIDEYEKTVNVTSGADKPATWSDLPTKVTYNGESYECAYFIAETKVTNSSGGAGTDITDNYEAAYTYSSQNTNLTTYTAGGTVYYQVTADDPLTVTNTAQESVILPMTGGLGAERKIVYFGCGLAALAVIILFTRRKYGAGGDCET